MAVASRAGGRAGKHGIAHKAGQRSRGSPLPAASPTCHPTAAPGCPPTPAPAPSQLHGLLASIEYPLGYRGHPHGPQLQHHTEQLATSLLQVDDDGSIYYHEVMQALTARAAGISISSLGHRVQLELKEETRYRKERQRQRQQQLRRRQLQRQQRIQRAGGQGRGRSAERSARSAGTLSRLVESIGRGGGQAATTSPPPASGRLDRSGSAASAVAAASVSLSEAPSADGFAMAAAAADCSPHTPRSPLGADGM